MEVKEEEIQSRREFFKEAAKKALPVIGAVTLIGNPLIAKAIEESLSDENDSENSNPSYRNIKSPKIALSKDENQAEKLGCYYGCAGACYSCVGTCVGYCYSCVGYCTSCVGTCLGTCMGCYSCTGTCITTCILGVYY